MLLVGWVFIYWFGVDEVVYDMFGVILDLDLIIMFCEYEEYGWLVDGLVVWIVLVGYDEELFE